jgi:hypothetical protein
MTTRDRDTAEPETEFSLGYVVDEHAVAEAILRRLRASSMLISPKVVHPLPLGVEEDGPAAGDDLP